MSSVHGVPGEKASTVPVLLLSALMLCPAAVSQSAAPQEPPKCGDDANEYLLEEYGQTNNGSFKKPPYGCATDPNTCVVSRDGNVEFRDTGTYFDTESTEELFGRYKNDSEVCASPSNSPSMIQRAAVLDQDISKNLCRKKNNLYGSVGRRWVNSTYVDDFPYAVYGGIDDDLGKGVSTTPGFDTLDSVSPNEYEGSSSGATPVTTGKQEEASTPLSKEVESNVATKGFCLGDDGGEHLVSQICRSENCVTDRKHLGAARLPGSCVFDGRESEVGDNAQPVNTSRHRRQLYQPGDVITLDYRQKVNLTCASGVWYEEGPVVFERDNKTVPLGNSVSAALSVVNLGVLKTDYTVELKQDTKAGKFSSFEDRSSDEFVVSVPPKKSKNLQLGINGIEKDLSDSQDDIEVTAEAAGGRIRGEDTLEIDVVGSNLTSNETQADQERNVPGLTLLEISVLAMVTSAAYFYFNWF